MHRARRVPLVIQLAGLLVTAYIAVVGGVWTAFRYFDTERSLSRAQATAEELRAQQIARELSVVTGSDTNAEVTLTTRVIPLADQTYGLIAKVVITNTGATTLIIRPQDALAVGRYTIDDGTPKLTDLGPVPFIMAAAVDGQVRQGTVSEIAITRGSATFSYYTEVGSPGRYNITFHAPLTAEQAKAIEGEVPRATPPVGQPGLSIVDVINVDDTATP